jgi:hypothetical protein
MKNKIARLVVLILVVSVSSSIAQDWRGIKPGKATCDDVKRLLLVKECSYPVSNYKFPEYQVNINFGGRKRSSKVTQVLVAFSTFVPLEKFGVQLSDYTKRPVGDLPNSTVYRNEKLGFEFTVRDTFGDGKFFVDSACLFLPVAKYAKLKPSI